MPGWNLLVAVCLGYVACLFAVAFWAERRAAQGRLGWLRAPMVYTLSLSVYCTAWTFYGAVGSAARGGLEYLPIYLGPTLVFVGWRLLPRKLLRVGHAQRITSIADAISSRYGKSPALGVIVTLIAVIGSTPYIALQLKSLTLSFAAFSADDAAAAPASPALTAFWVAAGLAVFTVLFGTRSVDADERHHGVVSAIAVEAVVKLGALLAVGAFVVWGVFSGPAAVFDAMPARLAAEEIVTPRWVTQTFLGACAVVCLPRMFHVLVVENVDERQLATAGWAFPLYLMLMSLPVLPIAIAGLATQPAGANPDLFMLSVPLAAGRADVALLAFLGGFSAATSMVIVAAIALSTMVSNHIVIPIWLRWRGGRDGDLRGVILLARRVSIAGVLALGYAYFLVSAPNALAAIGLISFAGAAQIAPALVGALYWRGATRAGAIAGISAGFAVWAYTLFLPSFEGGFLLSAAAIAEGPFGIGLLRPQALFGLAGWDPLVHAVFWSMAANVGAFVAVSFASTPRPLEQFQAAQFVDVFRQTAAGPGVVSRSATSEDLLALAARLLGPAAAQALFAAEARAQGRAEGLPAPTDRFINMLERELAGAVGAASAHELVAQTAGRGAVSADGLMRMADESVQLIDAKRRLERQSRELEDAAARLRDANDQLKRMDAAKDAFLSQVSHELRTPMTSIRSFAEILGDAEDLDRETTRRFLGIIRDESVRLTRLLDEILDLSFLESGRVTLKIAPVRIGDVIDRALGATEGLQAASGVPVARGGDGDALVVEADFDRLAQVAINLVSNAIKYGRSEAPLVTIAAGAAGDRVFIEVSDRGPGIPADKREAVFQKFQRLGEANLAGSAGLGLPIAREIMRNLGGDLAVLPNAPGAVFRAWLPRGAGQSAMSASVAGSGPS